MYALSYDYNTRGGDHMGILIDCLENYYPQDIESCKSEDLDIDSEDDALVTDMVKAI